MSSSSHHCCYWSAPDHYAATAGFISPYNISEVSEGLALKRCIIEYTQNVVYG